MKTCRSFSVIFIASILFVTEIIYAGPPVTVTFKNNRSDTATYLIKDSNEQKTYLNASPKPVENVLSGKSDIYSVQDIISPDINYAVVCYSIGGKTCEFSTNYTNIRGSVGSTPKWNKSFTASGGAICTANITSTNIATHAWSVEFTIK